MALPQSVVWFPLYGQCLQCDSLTLRLSEILLVAPVHCGFDLAHLWGDISRKLKNFQVLQLKNGDSAG